MASKDEKDAQQDDDEEESSDEEYVPKEDDPEEQEERALDAKLEQCEDDPDDPEASKPKKGDVGSKRKLGDAGIIMGRARARGGIMLDEDDAKPAQAQAPAEEEEAEEEESTKPKEEAPKPKSKIDDMWEEMKRGSMDKKPKTSGNVSSFIQGLVSKAGSGGGSSTNIAALFPTTVKQKQTYKVEEKLDFAGEKVVVQKEIEVGSAEDKKYQHKGPKKSNLDDLVARITGKQKKMTTQLKTEHDWMQYKSKAGIEDELQQYRKDGYLEKQRFLASSDAKLEEQLRQERQKEREERAKAAHAQSLARGGP